MILQAEEDSVIPLNLPGKEMVSDEALYQFCLANERLRIERDENNRVIVLSPIGGRTSKLSLRLTEGTINLNRASV